MHIDPTPLTIEDAINYIYDHLSKEEIKFILDNKNDKYLSVSCHFTFGRYIRNNWGLWSGESDLAKDFNNRGLFHADDMSGLLLESVVRKVLSQEIDIQGQIKRYQEYWEQYGNRENK